MTSEQQQVLFENTARNMQGTTKEVQLRHLNNCYKADPAYGERCSKSNRCSNE